jgi:hypothetical protein
VAVLTATMSFSSALRRPNTRASLLDIPYFALVEGITASFLSSMSAGKHRQTSPAANESTRNADSTSIVISTLI